MGGRSAGSREGRVGVACHMAAADWPGVGCVRLRERSGR